MFNSVLNKDAFISMCCQESRAGQGVTTRWAMVILQVSKGTVIKTLDSLVSEGVLEKQELPWRSNSVKFYYYPTQNTWNNYFAKVYRDGYNTYLRAMMQA